MCNLRSKIRPSHSPSSPGPARPGASRRNPTGQRRARFADGMASATRGRHRPTRWAQFMFRLPPPPTTNSPRDRKNVPRRRARGGIVARASTPRIIVGSGPSSTARSNIDVRRLPPPRGRPLAGACAKEGENSPSSCSRPPPPRGRATYLRRGDDPRSACAKGRKNSPSSCSRPAGDANETRGRQFHWIRRVERIVARTERHASSRGRDARAHRHPSA
jgi:hypothetical protein